eukprot:UN15365
MRGLVGRSTTNTPTVDSHSPTERGNGAGVRRSKQKRHPESGHVVKHQKKLLRNNKNPNNFYSTSNIAQLENVDTSQFSHQQPILASKKKKKLKKFRSEPKLREAAGHSKHSKQLETPEERNRKYAELLQQQMALEAQISHIK